MELNIVNTVYSAGCAIGNKYAAVCERGGKSVANFIGGRLISPQLAERLATETLKILPIALAFLALTPMLSLTSLVLAGAVCSTAYLLDSKTLSQNGKARVFEGAGLGIALQTILTVSYTLLTFSPVGAIGTVLVGSIASGAAFYASRKV